ncbi:MAG TPA: hypothetical protein VNG52_05390 [Stellaceae bacterium]|nr:hypothetical protein [Stellaceae bacterium]
MTKCIAWFRRLDGVCARLNSGLAAVAVVLSVLVVVQLTVRAETMLDDAQQRLAVPGEYALVTPVGN